MELGGQILGNFPMGKRLVNLLVRVVQLNATSQHALDDFIDAWPYFMR